MLYRVGAIEYLYEGVLTRLPGSINRNSMPCYNATLSVARSQIQNVPKAYFRPTQSSAGPEFSLLVGGCMDYVVV